MRRAAIGLIVLLLASGCSGNATPLPATSTFEPTQTATPTLTITPRPSDTAFPTDTVTLTEAPTIQTCDPTQGACVEAGHFLLERPIAPPGVNMIDRGYPYGSTDGGTLEPHHGVEFYNAEGTPVLAAADGQVVVAGDDSQTVYGQYPNTYGNLVVIEHHFEGIEGAVYTLYGHLSKVEAQAGQEVRAGEEIGKVGATGIATGSHLHFEVRLGKDDYDSNRNPVLWLKPITGQDGNELGVLAGRLQDAQGRLIHADSVNIQYFPKRDGPQAAAWQVETYAPEEHPVRGDDVWEENFTLGDMKAGEYRVSLMWGGKLYEEWVRVEAGKVTMFTFMVGG